MHINVQPTLWHQVSQGRALLQDPVPELGPPILPGWEGGGEIGDQEGAEKPGHLGWAQPFSGDVLPKKPQLPKAGGPQAPLPPQPPKVNKGINQVKTPDRTGKSLQGRKADGERGPVPGWVTGAPWLGATLTGDGLPRHPGSQRWVTQIQAAPPQHPNGHLDQKGSNPSSAPLWAPPWGPWATGDPM
jgi:hypothetical protein